MVDRQRLEEFRARFGIPGGADAFPRFRKRVTQAAETQMQVLSGADRVAVEKEFAFRNGSAFFLRNSWGAGVDIRHGIVDELADAKAFDQLVERIQHLLWTFESFGFFKDKQRYSESDYVGISFAGELARAIELSPGIDLRVQISTHHVDLVPAGVEVLDDAVDEVAQWLASFPDVQKEYRQALRILAEKRREQYRQAQDSLRFALEKLLKILLANNTRLEDQGKPLKEWLAARRVTEELRDVVVQIALLISKKYQNIAVKHDNSVANGNVKGWSDQEVEYVLYQYTTILRLLSETAQQPAT